MSLEGKQLGLWLETPQVKTWLTDLATRSHPLQQEKVAKDLLLFLRPPQNAPMVGEDFELRKAEIMKILLLLRSDMHNEEILEAAILLITCFIRGTTPGTTARILALMTADVYKRLVSIVVSSQNYSGPQAAAFRFFVEYATYQEAAIDTFVGAHEAGVEGSTAMSECISALDPQNNKSLGVRFWALEGLVIVSGHSNLRSILIGAGILHTLADSTIQLCNDTNFANLKETDRRYYTPRILKTTARLVKHLTAHSEENKKYLLLKGILSSIRWILQRPDVDDVKIEALHAFANLVIEPSDTLMSAIPALIGILSCGSSAHSEGSLRCIRNILVRGGRNAQDMVMRENGISLIIPHLEAKASDNQLHSLICIQILSLLPDARKEIAAKSLRLLLTFIDPAQKADQKVTHHSLCTLTNLALTDTVAQDITTAGSTHMFANIFHSVGNKQDNLVNSLSLLRNLCIDTPSCLSIASLGGTLLFEILFTTRNAQIRKLVMSILRNLILQNTYCRIEFWEASGFLDELIVDVTSTDADLQLYTVEIIWSYIASNRKRAKILADMDAMNALLLPMEREGLVAQLASKCFLRLKEVATSIDVWKLILAEWNEADLKEEQGRKKGRRKKGRGSSKATAPQPRSRFNR
ncbi:armadillo-type protein [Powellomyces hirtus]|nr:armadillo-type protein [Powellomyces hirtus]